VTVGTSPSANTQILVFAWGSHTTTIGGGSGALDTIVGTDADKTITSAGVALGFLKQIGNATVDSTTSNRGYYIDCLTLAQAFGNVPKFWGLFIAHNTGVALNSTSGNHVWKYQGIKY